MPPLTPAAHIAVPQVGIPSVASRMNLGLGSVRVFRYVAAFIIAAVVGVELPGLAWPSRVMIAPAFIGPGATSARLSTVQLLPVPDANSFNPQFTVVSTVGKKASSVIVAI